MAASDAGCSMALVPAAAAPAPLQPVMPQQVPLPQQPADSPPAVAIGRRPDGSPTALLSCADAAAALRKLANGRAGGTSITASMGLFDSVDTSQVSHPLAAEVPIQLPAPPRPALLAHRPSLLDQRLVLHAMQPKLPAPQPEAGAAAAPRLPQQEQGRQPQLESATCPLSPPPAEAIDEGTDEEPLQEAAPVAPQPLRPQGQMQPVLQQLLIPQQEAAQAAAPQRHAQPTTPQSVHPVAVAFREALTASREAPSLSPMLPWMLDAFSGTGFLAVVLG